MISTRSSEMFRFQSIALIAIIWCMIVQAASAQSIPVFAMVKRSELVDPEERISGDATVGVAYVASKDQPTLDAVFVFLAEPVNLPLELQLTTVDGRYLATFDYQPKAPVQGWVKLDVPVSRREFLSNYSINEIAPLVTVERSAMAYPVRWGIPEASTHIRLFMNTEGAHSFFVSYDERSKKDIALQCDSASSRSGFKFDQICDVPVSDIALTNSIDVLRKRGGGYGSTLNVQILVKGSVTP